MDSAIVVSDQVALAARDILQLKLQAELVVLSACGTARGHYRTGDEFLGLTRAFLRAGAKSLVVSLWKVDDLSTSLLMQEFYDRLQKGDPLTKALTGAQRHVRELTIEEAAAHCRRIVEGPSGKDIEMQALKDILRLQVEAQDIVGAEVTLSELEASDLGEQAMLTARRSVARLRARSARGMATSTPYSYPFRHPYHWGAFLLIGADTKEHI
jgi:CHAT domain-containing protein